MPKRLSNPGLAALIAGAGYRSLERFAQAVNLRGGQVQGLKLAYDHVTVKRWLAGSVCQNPDVVAAVLSEGWGIPIPVQVIWPELRDGTAPVAAHLQVWEAARTLEGLATFIGSDMLTRREILAESVTAATGAGLVNPLARWLGTPPQPFATNPAATVRIGLTDVERIEQATSYFAASDAAGGGGVSREAAVGQLKYAVDLARTACYRQDVGDRLLAAIADLAGWIGWMSHDLAMPGPAQRYLVYGLQAARESRDERGRLRAIGILVDLAIHQQSLGHPDTGLRLVSLALDRLPSDGRKLNKIRSLVWSIRARMLAGLGASYLPEVRSAIALAFDLHSQTSEEDQAPAVLACFPYVSAAELASTAATSYRTLAADDRRLAQDAATQALYALAQRPDGFTRSTVFDQIEVARARLLAGELDQAAADGLAAMRMAGQVNGSARITMRLRDLRQETIPYSKHNSVRVLNDALRDQTSAR